MALVNSILGLRTHLSFIFLILILIPNVKSFFGSFYRKQDLASCYDCLHKQSNFTSEKLKDFCNGKVLVRHNKSGIRGRCCVANDQIVGLDLSDCGQLNTTDMFIGHGSLEWMALNGNDHLRISSGDFRGLVNLTTIYVSANSSCPGSSSVWNKTQIYKGLDVKLCHHQRDSCTALNVSCPDNSYCLSDGPGCNLCLCSAGWGGYRCLRSGKFPAAEWLGGITGAFVGVTLLLRLAQEKSIENMKKKRKDEHRDGPTATVQS